MKRLKAPVLTLLLLAITPLASSAHDAETSAKLPHTVLLVGDSLSSAHRIPPQAGWVNLLQERVNATGTGAPKIIIDAGHIEPTCPAAG